jgi:large subunit ribosomal protein L18
MGIKIKNKEKIRAFKKARRIARVRASVSGTKERPRLAVERTLKHMRAQIIDDDSGRTLVAAGDHEISAKGGSASGGKGKTKGKTELAAAVGKLLAEKAKKAGIASVVFDRRANRFHGRIKALADAAREGGLIF